MLTLNCRISLDPGKNFLQNVNLEFWTLSDKVNANCKFICSPRCYIFLCQHKLYPLKYLTEWKKEAILLAGNADARNPPSSFSVPLLSLCGSSPAYVAQKNLIA